MKGVERKGLKVIVGVEEGRVRGNSRWKRRRQGKGRGSDGRC